MDCQGVKDGDGDYTCSRLSHLFAVPMQSYRHVAQVTMNTISSPCAEENQCHDWHNQFGYLCLIRYVSRDKNIWNYVLIVAAEDCFQPLRSKPFQE